jgi:type IV pilus assembly protein PilY1
MDIRHPLQAFRHVARRSAPLVTSALLSVVAFAAAAAPLALSDSPVFLTTGVPPNLIMAIDDSGSMDFEVLLPGNDGSAWWRSADSGGCTTLGANSFVGCIANGTTDVAEAGRLNFNNSGNSGTGWKKYAYLFPNGLGSGQTDLRRLGDSTNDHFAIPPIGAFAWARSPAYNRSYFDPSETYNPWVNGGGFTFANASITAARFDPVFGSSTINLTQVRVGGSGIATNPVTTTTCTTAALPTVPGNTFFRVFTGMTIPANTCIRRSATATGWATNDWALVGAAGCVVGTTNGCSVTVNNTAGTRTLPNDSSIAIAYFPATVYLPQASGGIPGYTATPVADGRAPDGSVLYRYEIRPANFLAPDGTTPGYDEAIQNFANWFTYFRKRHQALRAGLGRAFETLIGTRVAGFTINAASASGSSPDVTMLNIDVAGNRTTLYQNFYQTWTGSGGTPNRSAVANLVRNYRRTGVSAPVTHSCQRNFGMLFTDGFSNPPAVGDGITTSNLDGVAPSPYRDGVAGTLADHVYGAYASTIRPDLPQGRVSLPAACRDASPDPRLDCNANPHMNFYGITLGARGLQFNPDVVQDPFASPPTWPTTFPARHPSAVDDLWHATLNGRGQLLNASSSTELSEKLSSVLRSIADAQGSAAAASVSSGSINAESRLFQASFNSRRWTGELRAFPIGTTDAGDGLDEGELGAGTPATIPAPASRAIITVNSNGTTPVPFVWGSLDATRQAQLQPSDGLGPRRVDFLRGDRSFEQPGGSFRQRGGVLGDIINSSPAFVGAPAFRYPDSFPGGSETPYSAFRAAQANRAQMVYVGANDGMLHAFQTSGGATPTLEEVFAFIPGTVFPRLPELTDPAYSHQYYVDGTPSVVDAFVGGSWRSVLVGGLNKGGQGVFALNVTNGSAVRESNASSLFMWEFTDRQDADLGYTFSRPAIVRLRNGRWAAIFGNGYNNTEPDGFVSATGRGALFIVDLETGNLIRKLQVPAGAAQDPLGQGRPNGLATPAVVDLDGDGVADYAYAGDLFGNVWKFNLNSTAAADWRIAYGTPGAELPLFVARSAANQPQPITTRPQVGPGPNGNGMVVLIGSGKFLEAIDRDIANIPVHTFYGLWDRNSGSDTDILAARLQPGFALQQQTILGERDIEFTNPDGGEAFVGRIRVTSENALNLTTHRGWYLDFVPPSGHQGEMQVSDPVLRNGRIIFTTLIPDTDICSYGGRSWLMDMDALTGSRLPYSPFDLNRDRAFNDGDYAALVVDGTRFPVTGIGSDSIIARPAIIAGETADFAFAPDTGGGMTSPRVNPGPSGTGRQSWRQLR